MTMGNDGLGPEPMRNDGPQVTSREHAVIRAFLSGRVPHLVGAYDSIHAIFNGVELPSGPYLASHLIRDLINTLPAATLRGTKWEKDLHNPPNWRDMWFKLSDLAVKSEANPNPTDNLSAKAKKHIGTVLTSVETEKKKPRASELLIRSQLIPGEIPAQVNRAINDLEDHRKFFIRNTHLRDGAEEHDECATLDKLRARFRSLEVILAGFLGGSASALGTLNQWLIHQDPELLDDILERSVTPVLAMQFWNELTNADLIRPLQERGRFSPSVRVELTDSDEGTSAFLQSPSIRALGRLTPKNPQEAVRVWSSLRFAFSNDLHHLIEAAMACTGETACALGKLAHGYIQGGLRPFIERNVFKLIGHLVGQGGLHIALDMLDAMLALEFDKKRSYKQLQFKYCDIHDLRDKDTRKALQSLAVAAPGKCLEIVIDFIRSCNSLGDDWHGLTSVDNDPDNSDRDAGVALVELLRDVARWSFDAGKLTSEQLLEALESNQSVIEKRLSIYFTSNFYSGALCDEIMSTRGLFDDPLYKNEVANLYKKHFATASPQVRNTVLSWIEAGPDDEDDRKFLDHWRLCKLSWLSESLTDESLIQYSALLEKFGPDALDLADRNHHMTSGWGSVSPFTVDELTALPIDQAVKLVTEWKPSVSGAFRSPSLDGLADTFGKVVANNAVKWSQSALSISGMKPYFVSRSLNGWLAYARDKSDLDWSRLMDLADHVLALPISYNSTDGGNGSVNPKFLDHDWKWTRQCIAELISKACDHGVDISIRPRFIAALSKMIDEDPASSIVSDKDFILNDHASDALNSGRGKVAVALCDLAVWTAKADPTWDADRGDFGGDLSAIKDALSLIEQQLADVSSANAPTWAAYGFRANQLRWLAPQWYQAHVVDRITLVEIERDKPATWAFWMTFLKYQNPHRVWFRTHEASYRAMPVWMHGVEPERQEQMEVISSFLNHLMVYYWQGDLDLQDGGLIDEAFANAVPGKRMQAICYVGAALDRGEVPLEDVCQRFRALWKWYWSTYGVRDVAVREEDRHRQGLIGDWIASGHLGTEWSLTTLLEYLSHDSEAEHGDDVLVRLEEWCPSYPVQVLDATRLLVIGDLEGWRMHLWKEHVQNICEMTKGMVLPEVRQARANLLEALIRRGHVQFADKSLKPNTPNGNARA